MAGLTGETLRQAQIDPREIRHVIVTHFHADHIGGLAEFHHARIHYHEDALISLTSLPPLRQVHAAFLPKLVPAWLPERSHIIGKTEFNVSTELPFRVHDLFGDGLINLLDLPGHAPGHLGIWLPKSEGSLLYATDAYWHMAQIEKSVDLIPPVLKFQWDSRAYENTVRQLREVFTTGRHRVLACHAPETQALIGTAPQGP